MEQFLNQYPWVVALLVLWSISWKGVALWKSAKANQMVWFLVLLFVNTVGILEILYIFVFSKKNHLDNQKNKDGKTRMQ